MSVFAADMRMNLTPDQLQVQKCFSRVEVAGSRGKCGMTKTIGS